LKDAQTTKGKNQQKFSNHLGELMKGKVILSYLPYWLETKAKVPKVKRKRRSTGKSTNLIFTLWKNRTLGQSTFYTLKLSLKYNIDI